jgi:membrane protease YdiL (CAAX protease family)
LSSPENPQFDPQPALSAEPQTSLPLTPDPLLPASFPLAPSLLTPPPEPPRDPVWTGWDVLLIAVAAVLSLIVIQVLVLVGAKELIYPHSSWKEVAQKAVLAILAQFFAYIPVAFFMVALLEGKYHVRFWPAIRWNWPRSQWKMLGLGALVLLSLNFLGHFLPMPQSTPFEELFSRPRDAYLMSVFAITLGPLMEELFFRGFLYPVLARRMGVAWGIFFTALPFGLIHMFQYGYAWGVVLLIFLMGVVCTAVRAATGSVASSFLVHVGYNATEMLLFAVATDGFRHMEKAGMVLF